jgi:hypothetical protein
MALLSHKALFALKEEGTPGTLETVAASDVIKTVMDNPGDAGTITPLLFDDNTVHSELGEHAQFAPNVASWQPATITVALAGHAASTSVTLTKLPYGHLIEACGFEALDGDSGTNEVLQLTIGAITGTRFLHGETVTGAGTGDEGVVIGDTWNGTTTIYVEDTAGSGFANGTLTGGTSGATATVSATATRRPHAYRLISDPEASTSLTIARYFDGKRMQAKGARGNMVLRVDHANRPFLDFSFTGVLHNAGASTYHVTDTAFPTGVTYFDRTAPASLGIGLTLHDGSLETTPVFSALTLDVGNGVVLQENTNDSDGWDVARITTRNPRLTLNPREVLEAEGTFIDNWIRGVASRTRFTFGSTAGNIFTFMVPFLMTEGLTGADRASVIEWNGTFRATKGSFTSGAGATSFGANNEIVLIVT